MKKFADNWFLPIGMLGCVIFGLGMMWNSAGAEIDQGKIFNQQCLKSGASLYHFPGKDFSEICYRGKILSVYNPR